MTRYTGMVGALLVGLALGATGSGMFAQQAPPAAPAAPAAQATAGQEPRGTFGGPAGPCGPQAHLPIEFAKNVDANARCFEIRMYTVNPERIGTPPFNGGINELHQRFREKEVALFQKHGAQIVGVWQHLGNQNTLVWMLAYRDRAHREEVWAKFAADPEWTAIAAKYRAPLTPSVFLMSATDYSPLK